MPETLFSVNQIAQYPAADYQHDGVGLVAVGSDEYRNEQNGTDNLLGMSRSEILSIHQHQCGGGQQADHSRAETAENRLDCRMPLIFQEKAADQYHEYERREHD